MNQGRPIAAQRANALNALTRKGRGKMALMSPAYLARRLTRLSERVLASAAMHLTAHREKHWGEPELRLLPFLVRRDEVAVGVGRPTAFAATSCRATPREYHTFEANPDSPSAIPPWWRRIHGVEAWDPPGRLVPAAVPRTDLVTTMSRYTRQRLLAWADLEQGPVGARSAISAWSRRW